MNDNRTQWHNGMWWKWDDSRGWGMIIPQPPAPQDPWRPVEVPQPQGLPRGVTLLLAAMAGLGMVVLLGANLGGFIGAFFAGFLVTRFL